ncbi:TPA: DUF262 domain-containing protein [Pseudomonas aeruginosa]|uniref:DUF262 domain-containing protein n=1 Tax=Pseudomonas aeruginosa TaxID=287 RepID=UPI0008FB3BBE|nr:DUF262 domain-containing protein [Pseudomonas aeruginosa]MCD2749157.1 DUF262 domain-containing protein [Pseudomonas aeruginosa]MCO3305810.1 DUF262 domain-containing protein [Pseudomonas aeruginosa]NTT99595.1 DUF262 domain-containing protein [Pseudomonas aeruginosa]OPD88724.1 hypothetical protein AO965_30510 [Pseudomonas aeruginosa]HBN9523048.1 DUF262 domain-containing protein [Pseudomonas aeruginosa]
MVIDDNVVQLEVPQEENEDFYSDDDLFEISSWGADLSFRELISRYDDNELVKPELQRNYVWDKAEASRFVDSILLGLPVPSIFLAKTNDEKLLIIDGYQRLMTVRDYVKGIFTKDGTIFKLSKSDKIHDRWKGKAFVELQPEEQRKIRNTTIHAIVFMQKHPAEGDTSLFQVFERINSGGRSLLPQEIRNCVYQGPFNTLLFDLNSDPTWRTLWGSPDPDSRMRDMECILRFFAISDLATKEQSKTPSRVSLKKHLNQYMGEHNEESYCQEFRYRFLKAVYFAHQCFGENAFHNISPSNPDRAVPAFSATIFDSVLIAIDIAIKEGHASSNTGDIAERRKTLLLDRDFQRLISFETMRTETIRGRVWRMYHALFSGV